MRPIGGRLKKYFFSLHSHVCGRVIICALLWEAKGLLGHWLTYSGFSFLSPPLMAVFSSLSIMGPIISSSFSLSSSWMISISLTGSTVPSTWMISSSSKAPGETRHVVRRYRIPDLFSAGTHQCWQNIEWKRLSSENQIWFIERFGQRKNTGPIFFVIHFGWRVNKTTTLVRRMA